MRVIEAFDGPVRAVTVSPDGRFLAAAAGYELVALDWLSGAKVVRVGCPAPVGQAAFTADGNWVVFAYRGGVFRVAPGAANPVALARGAFSGGVAVSPDGKTLAATRAVTWPEQPEKWVVPGWRTAPGHELWPPFERLAYSPNGEYVAGINRESFELRFAESGGLNRREGSWEGRYLPPRLRRAVRQEEPPRSAFLTFARHSETVVFGWDAELRVMETRAGNVLKRVAAPGRPFADAAFVGSGRHLATVDGTGVMRLWSAESWAVAREYDWGTGGLTCVAATADGLAGVCGTDSGKLVVFDVDE